MGQSSKKIAVTGMGSICGLGNNLGDIWQGLIDGKSGISNVDKIDLSEMPTKFGGIVKDFQISEKILSPKDVKRYDDFLLFILNASAEAYTDCGIVDSDYQKDKIGCILGVGMGGFPMIEKTHEIYMAKGQRRVSPFFIPGVIPNMSSGLVSIYLGLHGINYSISSACASSAHAISAACYEIQSGRHDVMVTGGGEGAISYLAYAGFSSMKALSRRNENPEMASRPFDKDRDGFVIGEGAGVLVLEELERAKARGAKIYATIEGHGASSDAYHITAPHPEGIGAIISMEKCIKDAGISPEQIGYINAHGTSTPLGDIAETTAIKKVFGDCAKNINISSSKSMTGHLLGGAGGLETIICIKAMMEGIIPPTINLDNQDPACDLNYTPNVHVKRDIPYALNNSFGFGGTNSTLILKNPNL
ncbi:MAG: beta-ketoacyl-ACP synthase II [Bacteriovoracaceae bacterium]|jgi:3-oxoacyl-[acyl-carrier-protein] synthase II|nr:beta-ketoacyl-ACP synthase II [Bacteriovoracaceae bacterium]